MVENQLKNNPFSFHYFFNPKSMKSSQSSFKKELLFCLFIALAIVSIYGQVLNHEFVNYDDDIYITSNQYLQNGLTFEGIKWAFNFQDKGKTYWHPLAWLSHMADISMFGTDAGFHHLVNMLWHLLNTWLLFFLLNRMTGMFWLSVFTAALFAVHPINIETVAWVSQRKNLLSTFFWLLSMATYVFYTNSPNVKKYLLLFGVFVAGLMAKPMLITLPFVFLLLDYWPLQRISSGPVTTVDKQVIFTKGSGKHKVFRCLLEKIPLICTALLTTHLVTRSFPETKFVSFVQIPLQLRMENLLVSYVSYIGKLLWPFNLAILYPFPESLSLVAVMTSFILLIILTVVLVVYLRTHKLLTVGWLWFLGTLAPVSGLIQAGIWPAMADRWAYIPAIGLFLIISWFIQKYICCREKKQVWSISALVGLVVVLGTISWNQVRCWQNSISLFEHTVSVTSDNVVAHSNLGEAYWGAGRFAEALKEYQEAFRLYPYSARINNSIGIVLKDMNNCQEARKAFERAIALGPNNAMTYSNLGVCYANIGDYSKAVWAFKETLRLNPNDTAAQKNLIIANTLNRKPE